VREQTRKLPAWFKIRISSNERMERVRNLVREHKLHTVCRSAACPNQTECWNAGTATFLILGNVCTRGCRFCNVPKGRPEGLDQEEPGRVADAVAALNLNYAVITSVTRDDLPDGGAAIFAETIRSIRVRRPGCRVETLVPDFNGSRASLRTVLDAMPDVLNHNLETVPSQYPRVRPQADYKRSLELLKRAYEQGAVTKTGLMLGLGETMEELGSVISDAAESGCSLLTLGQYLQPGKAHLPVEKYYHPDEFEALRQEALSRGFRQVVAGPLVRSSYHAEQYG
jgi:lipoic acid synthetase